jgi:hypothetical protein
MSKTNSEEKSISIPAWLVTGTPESARMLQAMADLALIRHELDKLNEQLRVHPIAKRQAG